MTFLEICKLVRQECGIPGDNVPSAVSNQRGMLKRVVEWVQAADMEIQDKNADWDFLWSEFSEDTILDQDGLAAPDDFGMWSKEFFAINRGTIDGRPLNFIEYKDWQLPNYLKVSDEPYSVTILPNSNLALSAPADGVYPVYGVYWRAPVYMALAADVPPYPSRYHRIVVERAKMYFYEDQEAWDNFKTATMAYDAWMVKLEGFAAPGQQFRSQAQPPPMAARAE